MGALRITTESSKPDTRNLAKSGYERAIELTLTEVAGLPSEQEPEDEEAKRFDLLILNLQLAVLRVEPAFQRLSDQVPRPRPLAPKLRRRCTRAGNRKSWR